MRRLIASLFKAAVIAGVTVALVESIGSLWWHPPANIDINDPAQLARLMPKIPLANKLLVVIAWALGPFVGARVLGATDPENALPVAGLLGVLFTAFPLMMVAAIPHPWWMTVAAVLLPFPAAALGGWLGMRTGLS